jgi:PhnB protein
MEFYHKCLGGELHFQSVGGSPSSKKMPEKMKRTILHAVLICDNFVLMGSDMVHDKGLVKGNAMAIVLNCTGEKEIRSCYKKLSENGEERYPLKINFWGTLFGCVTDKYGNYWILNYSKDQKAIKRRVMKDPVYRRSKLR